MLKRELVPVWVGLILMSTMFLTGQETWPPDPPCTPDAYEQNDSSAAAYDFGSITDCDGDAISISANVEPAYEDDWYKVHIMDDVCTIVPTFQLSGIFLGETYRMCVDYYCDSSSTPSVPDASQCILVNASGTINLSVNCLGFDESGTALIRVEPQTGGECRDYTLDFHG